MQLGCSSKQAPYYQLDMEGECESPSPRDYAGLVDIQQQWLISATAAHHSEVSGTPILERR